MLRFLRAKGKSWVLKALLGFVALTFVSFGGFALTDGPSQSGGARVAAWVDEAPISAREFEQRYYEQAEALRRQLGDAYNEELARRLGVRRRALDSLILEKLQLREARRLGIQATDSEVALQIQSLPPFQREGRFDARRYRAVLESNGLTPRQFEEAQRRVVLLGRLRDYVNMSVSLSDREVRDAWEWSSAEIKLAAIRLKPEAFAREVPALEADLKEHYEKNRDEFRTAPQRRASWWRLPFSEAAKGVELNEADLRAHYGRARAKYARRESISVNQVFLKLPPDAKEEQIEAKRKLLEQLRERVVKGEKFTELAKAHSEGPAAKQGGDLGTFGRGEMLPGLEQAAFDLKEGEVSPPVKTSFGMHLVWARERVPPGHRPFDEAREEVEKELRDLRARQRARSELRKVRYAVEDNKAEPRVAGLQKGETGFFERGRLSLTTPGAGVVSELAFGLSGQEKISREREDEEGVSFVRLDAKRAPFVPKFEDARAEVERSFLRLRGGEIAKRKAALWLQELKDKKRDLHGIAREIGLSVLVPGAFKRMEAPPALGASREVAAAAFSIEAGGFGMAEAGGEVILFEVLEAPEADMKKLESEKGDVRRRMLQVKRALAFGRYLEKLRNAAEVRFEEGFGA